MLRLAVAFLWDRSRTIAELSPDGQPSEALATAAGVRWRGAWQAGVTYQDADGVVDGGAAWRAVGAPVGRPGMDPKWAPSGEADLFALVGRSLVAENGGVPVTVRALQRTPSLRARGLGAGGPAGSPPRR